VSDSTDKLNMLMRNKPKTAPIAQGGIVPPAPGYGDYVRLQRRLEAMEDKIRDLEAEMLRCL